jgi:protein-tyrosine phosphatase
MRVRTSITDPLRQDLLSVGSQGGLLWISLCPGKTAPSLEGTPWARDLDLDLHAIQHWGAQAVLTLIEDAEFEMLQVQRLGASVKARGIDWHHLPIADQHAPDERFEARWAEVGAQVCGLLAGGGRALVHCRGGLGRAGTVAARILVQTGTPPADAIRQVRAARKDAIENATQERYVMALGAAPGR